MIALMRNLIKISFFLALNFLFLSCLAQSKALTKGLDLDQLINIYIQNNPKVNYNDSYLELGIENSLQGVGFKNFYLRNFCKNCPYKAKDKSLFIKYKGFDMVIIYDNDINKQHILKKLTNFSYSERFSFQAPDPNVLLNFKYWMLSYDDKNGCYYVCAEPEMINLIKEKLNINLNVDDCLLD